MDMRNALPLFYLPAVKKVTAYNVHQSMHPDPIAFETPSVPHATRPVTAIDIRGAQNIRGVPAWIAACDNLEIFKLSYGLYTPYNIKNLSSLAYQTYTHSLISPRQCDIKQLRGYLLPCRHTLKTLSLTYESTWQISRDFALTRRRLEDYQTEEPFGSFKEFEVLEELHIRHWNIISQVHPPVNLDDYPIPFLVEDGLENPPAPSDFNSDSDLDLDPSSDFDVDRALASCSIEEQGVYVDPDVEKDQIETQEMCAEDDDDHWTADEFLGEILPSSLKHLCIHEIVNRQFFPLLSNLGRLVDERDTYVPQLEKIGFELSPCKIKDLFDPEKRFTAFVEKCGRKNVRVSFHGLPARWDHAHLFPERVR
ncbi:hypothetical protein BO70DRAFT_359173 [Aspergillus heteromorphus CBS 117.55]|uniref:Uncharacterized protein n=1 Tax=Aspergillus heteromorphus CBS 117.55 TaxID=1448321 RepID=A0A317WZM4_9EURO|nr:uncharacterized protein BO70DRAFT_359173 [Aspergillus heteromorphus CBS 117.55]PWY90178.1 hypothetical protein BO70DRAFT_359173 [Aspergillus heteromorphus CBS 117.55]